MKTYLEFTNMTTEKQIKYTIKCYICLYSLYVSAKSAKILYEPEMQIGMFKDFAKGIVTQSDFILAEIKSSDL